MTTQDCADTLNELAGEKIFDRRMIRQRVEDGELQCVNPHRSPRERVIISAHDFCVYVQKYHPQFIDAVKRKFPQAA